MRQTTLAEGSFAKYKKPTRKEIFLSQMEDIIPWKELSKAIEPHYPNPKGSGRRPIGIERMLRIHFMQHWFTMSDPAMEEALYDIPAMREFAGIDLGREPAPDETTICKFRHLLEKKSLGERLFQLVNTYLEETVYSYRKERLLMRRSLTHRPRPRIKISNGTLTCTRPVKAINGISG